MSISELFNDMENADPAMLPKLKASEHANNRDLLPAWMEESVVHGVNGYIGLNVPTSDLSKRKKSTQRSLNETPKMVGKFYRRAHEVNCSLFHELKRQASFYSPDLEKVLMKLWQSVDRVVVDMANALDTHALHIHALQKKAEMTVEESQTQSNAEIRSRNNLMSKLKRAESQIGSFKARAKLAERLEKKHKKEIERLEEMLNEFVYGADAKDDKPDYLDEYTVLEEMEENLIELNDEMLWSKSILSEMDSLVSRVGVANEAALQEAARLEEERIQKTMAHAEAQAQLAAKKSRKQMGNKDNYSRAKRFLMATQKKTLGALSREAGCQAGSAHLRMGHRFGKTIDLISARERKEKGQKTDTSGHDATAPVNSLSVSELLNTVDYFPHLMFSQDRSKEKSRMPQNTHETLVATSGVSSASPKTSLSRKSPKSTRTGSGGHSGLSKGSSYKIDAKFLSPRVQVYVDVYNLRARSWCVFDTGTLCHKIMSIYANYMLDGTHEGALLNQEQKLTRMKNRRDAEAPPSFVAAKKQHSCFLEFVSQYFESSMNVKSLGDWHAAQLVLNVTRYHDESISENPNTFQTNGEELPWYEHRILLFGRFVEAFDPALKYASGAAGENKEGLDLMVQALKMVCRMTPTIDSRSLTNETMNQSIEIDYNHVATPIFYKIMQSRFSATSGELERYNLSLREHAQKLAKRKQEAAAAAANGDVPRSSPSKRAKRSTIAVSSLSSMGRRGGANAAPKINVRPDKLELDFFFHVLLKAFWDSRRKRIQTISLFFETFRRKSAPDSKQRIMKYRKQGYHAAVKAMEENAAEYAGAGAKDKLVQADISMDFEAIHKRLTEDENVSDALELGLLPWSDVPKVVSEIQILENEIGSDNSSTGQAEADAESSKESKSDQCVSGATKNVLDTVNALARDSKYWDALVNNGVFIEAKKRTLERAILEMSSPTKQKSPKRNRHHRAPIYGFADEWKNYTEEDIEVMVQDLSTSPGIDAQTFAELLLQNKIGWKTFENAIAGDN